MPRKFTKPIGTNVSPSEYEVIKSQLVDENGIAIYLRRLMIADAERRGIEWPFETKTRGKYPRAK